MRRFPALLLLLVLLTGCAEVWTRPGTTEAEAEAMADACREEASLAVPPQLMWQVVEPARIERDRHCRVEHGRERCWVRERYRPARWGQVDVNERPRDAWRRNCMGAKGFRFDGYRPLRLE